MEKMLQAMMKRFPLFIGMGVMIVIISVIIGAVNGVNAANYYAVDKAARDASLELAQIRAGIESTLVWLPYFKFLGVAMILGGITMALGVIATRLQTLGQKVMASVPVKARVEIPPKPMTVYLMRMLMMLGLLIIIVGFIVSLNVAGTASIVYSNPVVAIDAAETGSPLQAQLAGVHQAEVWLEVLKFVGVAFLFLGIVYSLATIIFALRYQRTAILQVANKLPAPTDTTTPTRSSIPAADAAAQA